ncbi:MAG: hypothetical protein ACHQSE_01425 [Gemmatimonadales bacterium]
MKIERALGLLPAIDAMPSVRALLLSTDTAGVAGALRIGVNDTVGKRDITAEELRERMRPEFERVVAHLASLYEAYFSAVEALDGGAPEAAVRSLVTAGQGEQAVGRVEQAEVWYQAALGVAEGLVDRKPEIETLLALGALTRWLDFYDDSTRRYRRALVLAESVFDMPSAISACVGLGLLLVEQGRGPAPMRGSRAHCDSPSAPKMTCSSRTSIIIRPRRRAAGAISPRRPRPSSGPGRNSRNLGTRSRWRASSPPRGSSMPISRFTRVRKRRM